MLVLHGQFRPRCSPALPKDEKTEALRSHLGRGERRRLRLRSLPGFWKVTRHLGAQRRPRWHSATAAGAGRVRVLNGPRVGAHRSGRHTPPPAAHPVSRMVSAHLERRRAAAGPSAVTIIDDRCGHRPGRGSPCPGRPPSPRWKPSAHEVGAAHVTVGDACSTKSRRATAIGEPCRLLGLRLDEARAGTPLRIASQSMLLVAR
jgi:hypothetical protein